MSFNFYKFHALRKLPVMPIGIHAFHGSLDERDRQALKLSRNIFHASTFLPLLLYHLRTSEAKPLFPATISHSIRKGPPRWTQHALWLAGWGLLMKTFWRPAGPPHLTDGRGKKALTSAELRNLRIYSSCMFLCGVISIIVCPLGKSKKTDRTHFFTAGTYIACHVPVMSLLRMPWWPYRMGFYMGFAVLGLAIKRRNQLLEIAGVGERERENEDTQRAAVERAPAELQAQIYLANLAIMVAEYGLFVGFISGMAAGEKPAKGGLQKKTVVLVS